MNKKHLSLAVLIALSPSVHAVWAGTTSTGPVAKSTQSIDTNGPIASAPKELKLTREECIPFDLEKGGTVAVVPYMEQYYSNCYSSAAAGIVSSYLTSKKSIHEESSDAPRSDLYDRSLEEIRASSRYAVSPHHLAISYAYYMKSKLIFPSWKDLTSAQKTAGSGTDHAEFLSLVQKPGKTPEEAKRLSDIAMVEGRFGSEAVGKTFFGSIRRAYNDYLWEFADHNRLGASSVDAVINRVFEKMNTAYETAYIPIEGRLPKNEIRALLLPPGKNQEYGPTPALRTDLPRLL